MKPLFFSLLLISISSALYSQDLKAEQDTFLKYAKAHKIKEKKIETTESGLMYYIAQSTKNPLPQTGEVVYVHYTGKLLNDVKFDSSRDRNEPYSFPLGKGRVIKGWDEGIALLPKGSRAVLFIPSSLAYGERSIGDKIKPNTPLIFEVELLNK